MRTASRETGTPRKTLSARAAWAAGTNTALIGHAGFTCAVLQSLAWGEAAIFKPDGAGGTQFVEEALKRNLLCVPGCVFSRQDTHVRISYATDDDTIRRGCKVLRGMV